MSNTQKTPYLNAAGEHCPLIKRRFWSDFSPCFGGQREISEEEKCFHIIVKKMAFF